MPNFTTGPATLPDVGELSYNGCVFSPLFTSQVSGEIVKDEAKRTTKYIEYTIVVDGYVTLPDGAADIGPTMFNLRRLLTEQGGALFYQGRGCDIIVNPGDDVAWGPRPELLEFQPLGAGRSAKIVWQVKTAISEENPVGLLGIPILQFNYQTTVTYDEAGYSTLNMMGVIEIPLTRKANQKDRTLKVTADEVRSLIETRILDKGVDLGKFHPTNREISISRDKRMLNWNFTYQEQAYMDMPQGCTMARGSFTCRPTKMGPGLVSWFCTLRATYTVRLDKPRRLAWLAFLALLRTRIIESQKADAAGPNINVGAARRNAAAAALQGATIGLGAPRWFLNFDNILKAQAIPVQRNKNAFLVDFSFDEGLYLDSRTVSFSATWKLTADFKDILIASGLWKKVPERDNKGNSLWAASMRDISGAQSWLPNKVDPKIDIIVDFGGN